MLSPKQAKHWELLRFKFEMPHLFDSSTLLSVSPSQLFALEYILKAVSAVYCGTNYG